MIKINDITTSKADLLITSKALAQSIKYLPRMIWTNIIFIGVITVLETAYHYIFIIRADNSMMTTLSSLNFAFLKLILLIFLIPFQMYNIQLTQHSKPLLLFAPFIKRTTWPILIESLKAIFIIIGYCIPLLILYALLFTFWNHLQEFLFQSHIYMSLFIFLTAFPVIIRSIQFHFIPFVIFFNQEYIKDKTKVLQRTIQVSKGIALPLLILGIVFSSLSAFLHSFIEKGIQPSISVINISFFGVNSLLKTIEIALLCVFLYLIYRAKDPSSNPKNV